MTNDHQVTPASAWKRPTRLVELPSGSVVEVREIDLPGMIIADEQGNVPDVLTQQIVEGLKGGKSPRSPKQTLDLTAGQLPGLTQFATQVTRACLVNPTIVTGDPNYDAGEIALDDVDVTDRFFLLQQMMPGKELAVAERFRNGSKAGVAAVQPGEDVRPKAE